MKSASRTNNSTLKKTQKVKLICVFINDYFKVVWTLFILGFCFVLLFMGPLKKMIAVIIAVILFSYQSK